MWSKETEKPGEVDRQTLFPEVAALNPGGSGIPVDFGFAGGGLLRSITHCGGGGGGADIFEGVQRVRLLRVKSLWCCEA
jgi:hypothetical protein